MKLTARGSQVLAYWTAVCLMLLLSWNAHGQSCQTASEIDAANKTAIQTTAQRYFDMASKGDAASLRQNAIPSLASDFTGIEGTIKENQANLSGAQAAIMSYFLLDASGPAPIPNAEFYCGVFGKTGQTANSAAFYLNSLPPAKYAVVLLDATSSAGRTMVSEVLQQVGTDWKLGGLYIKSAQVAGHARVAEQVQMMHAARDVLMRGRDMQVARGPCMPAQGTGHRHEPDRRHRRTERPRHRQPAATR